MLFCLPLRSDFVALSAPTNSPKEKHLVWRKPGSNKGFYHFCPWLGFILAGGGLGSPPPQLGWLRNGVHPRDAPGEGNCPLARSIPELMLEDTPGLGTRGEEAPTEDAKRLEGSPQGGGQHLIFAGVPLGAPPSSPTLGGGGVGASRAESKLDFGGRGDAKMSWSMTLCGKRGPGEASRGKGKLWVVWLHPKCLAAGAPDEWAPREGAVLGPPGDGDASQARAAFGVKGDGGPALLPSKAFSASSLHASRPRHGKGWPGSGQ